MPIDDDPGTTGGNTFSAKIDGVDWMPASITGFEAYGSLLLNAAASGNTSSIGLNVPSNISPGVYDLDWNTDIFGQYNIGISVFMQSTSGTLTITQHNTTTGLIEGSFSFDAEELAGTETAEITDGEFSITY